MKEIAPVARYLAPLVLVFAVACSGAGEDAPAVVSPPPAASRPAPDTGGTALVPFAATGDLYALDMGCDCVLRIAPDGTIAVAIERDAIRAATGIEEVAFVDAGIVFDTEGTLFFVESTSGTILRRKRDGAVEALVTNAAIAAVTGAELGDPEGMAFGTDGMLYVIDDEGAALLRVDPASGAVAVHATQDGLQDGELIAVAELDAGIVGGVDGTLYVTTQGAPPGVLAILDGKARVVAGNTSLDGLDGYMTRTREGDLLVADRARDLIRRVTLAGDVDTYLNEATIEQVLGVDVELDGGLALDADGNLYFVDDREDVVLRFEPNGEGRVWISMRQIREITGVRPDLDSGIAFEPR